MSDDHKTAQDKANDLAVQPLFDEAADIRRLYPYLPHCEASFEDVKWAFDQDGEKFAELKVYIGSMAYLAARGHFPQSSWLAVFRCGEGTNKFAAVNQAFEGVKFLQSTITYNRELEKQLAAVTIDSLRDAYIADTGWLEKMVTDALKAKDRKEAKEILDEIESYKIRQSTIHRTLRGDMNRIPTNSNQPNSSKHSH